MSQNTYTLITYIIEHEDSRWFNGGKHRL